MTSSSCVRFLMKLLTIKACSLRWNSQHIKTNLTSFWALFTEIPYEPPPTIANGEFQESDSYVYGSSVTYRCQSVPKGTDPFSLIGTATISCTADAHSVGVWSGPPPECRGCWDFLFFTAMSGAFFGSGVGGLYSRKKGANALVQSLVQFQWWVLMDYGTEYWLKLKLKLEK